MDERVKDIIAPAAVEITPNYIKLGNKYATTLFIFTYPRYLATGWFSPVINYPDLIDISIHINPIDAAEALKNLRKKATQVEAQLMEQEEDGKIRSPVLETAREDIESLRDSLQQAQENLFTAGAYVTLYAETVDALKKLEGRVANLLESRLIYTKPALFQQMEGLGTVFPAGQDKLGITTPLNSGPLSSFFPFVSLNMTSDEGIMYGVNRHNNTLVIFDRFSLENANMVIFAKSGSGKSYTAKLEALRLLMTGVDVLIIDPENEYETLAQAVGGSYFKISLASEYNVNPFDIPVVPEDESPEEVLRTHIVNLTGLLKLMVGETSSEEDTIIDRALTEVYASREIIAGQDFAGKEPPLLKDMETILRNMDGGASLADRLYRYTQGSFSGFTNKPTNIDLNNRLIIFSMRDLEDELRPIAMYIILNFIWSLIRARLKKRIVFIDEAWILMKNQDSATFLFGLVKRARKYFLGVTTITQDVEDFLLSPYGRPIITNSSLQLLLKQAPAMMDSIAKTFDLSEGERGLLLEASVGQGLFFAGFNHVAIQIVASYAENQLITTNPEEVLANKQQPGAQN
ncbi:MAG: conjugal transfer protein TraC [Candidatus Harrisonbacteria bacterium CG10_big_fil_rev_8_21_14_0_10_49_15]|uniref:Conjugal transfer protein TraC n=1 Tax=Candidatus Harrisonbacteria bacterium CG10_big_fil_rev_8_21_14_0_10_49_15 TaxID=1974587 RepID=A0A2H0UKC9_9BACT|nr:MAG: conjugal transfer protein TraC [Candidatus Harrisonbacteria bacterium CG10_big_fil_rev_8_21_14_0_10_49_15]